MTINFRWFSHFILRNFVGYPNNKSILTSNYWQTIGYRRHQRFKSITALKKFFFLFFFKLFNLNDWILYLFSFIAHSLNVSSSLYKYICVSMCECVCVSIYKVSMQQHLSAITSLVHVLNYKNAAMTNVLTIFRELKF